MKGEGGKGKNVPTDGRYTQSAPKIRIHGSDVGISYARYPMLEKKRKRKKEKKEKKEKKKEKRKKKIID